MPAQVKRSPRKRLPKAPTVTKSVPSVAPDIACNRIRPRTFATDEKRAQALELFRHGIGYTKASRILDMSPNTLRDWHRAFIKGAFKADLADNQYRYPKPVRERAVRLRLQGYSWSEINRLTGISVSTVRKWVLAHTETGGRKTQILVERNESES